MKELTCRYCQRISKNVNSHINHERCCPQNKDRKIRGWENLYQLHLETVLCQYCKKEFNISTIKRHESACIYNPVIQQKIEQYNAAPKLCENCRVPLSYKQVTTYPPGKYCTKRCAVIVNNKTKRHSDSSKRKIGESVKRRFDENPEIKDKIRNSLKGRKHSPEALERIAEGNRRRSTDSDFKEKMRRLNLEKTGGIHSQNLAPYALYESQLRLYEEGLRRHPDNERVLQVICYKCKEWMSPTPSQVSNRLDSLKHHNRGESHFYCSDECKKQCDVFAKQPLPPRDTTLDNLEIEVQLELRQLVLERDEYTCQKCGLQDLSGKGLQCHHLDTVKCEPLESADVDICITYCSACHIEAHQQPGCTYNDLKNYEFDKNPIFSA
jgi:hypothetical protein